MAARSTSTRAASRCVVWLVSRACACAVDDSRPPLRRAPAAQHTPTPPNPPHSKHTQFYVLLVAIIAASGGLLFGFDNGIVSHGPLGGGVGGFGGGGGAPPLVIARARESPRRPQTPTHPPTPTPSTSPHQHPPLQHQTGGVIAMEDFQRLFFPHMLEGVESTDPFCKYDDHMLQLFTSSLFLAGAVAAMVGSYTCKRYGRKATMAAGGFAFLAGTILVATAFAVPQLVVGRIVLGVGVGFATQATPLYLSELAPHHLRGSLNILFQLAVTLGILGAQLINYGTSNIKPWGWRLSLALGAVPALTLFIGSIMLPDTPNSLVQRGQGEKGLKVLRRVRGVEDVHAEFDDITAAVDASNAIKVNPFVTILKRRYRPHLVISVLIPICQQLTGMRRGCVVGWVGGWVGVVCVGGGCCLCACCVFLSCRPSSDPPPRTHTHTHTPPTPKHPPQTTPQQQQQQQPQASTRSCFTRRSCLRASGTAPTRRCRRPSSRAPSTS